MRVCQYVGENVLRRALTPEGFWVKASNPCDFNDPFECTGGVFGYPTCSLVEEFYKRRPDQELVASLHGDRTKHVGDFLCRAFQDRSFLGQAYKISCFVDADRSNRFQGSDIRMWMHYANRGMGVRLEFDTEKMPFRPEVVKYENVAPKLDLSTVRQMRDINDFIEKCLITKHKIWEPEQEVRIIFRGPNDIVQFDPENKIYRWLLPLESFAGMTIGESLFKARDSKIDQLLRSVIKRSGRNLTLNTVVRDYNVYGMAYRPISI